LIDIAVKCQEAQLKLRHVYEKFPKEADLVKVFFFFFYPQAIISLFFLSLLILKLFLQNSYYLVMYHSILQ